MWDRSRSQRALKGAACRHVCFCHSQGQNKGTLQTEKLTNYRKHLVVGFQPFKAVEIWQPPLVLTCFFVFLAVSTKPIPNWNADAIDGTSNLSDTVRVISANLHTQKGYSWKMYAKKTIGNSLLQHHFSFHAGCPKSGSSCSQLHN